MYISLMDHNIMYRGYLLRILYGKHRHPKHVSERIIVTVDLLRIVLVKQTSRTDVLNQEGHYLKETKKVRTYNL